MPILRHASFQGLREDKDPQRGQSTIRQPEPAGDPP